VSSAFHGAAFFSKTPEAGGRRGFDSESEQLFGWPNA